MSIKVKGYRATISLAAIMLVLLSLVFVRCKVRDDYYQIGSESEGAPTGAQYSAERSGQKFSFQANNAKQPEGSANPIARVDVLRTIRDDLRNLGNDRFTTFYADFTPLINAGVSQYELQLYQTGLTWVVNSVSNSERLIPQSEMEIKINGQVALYRLRPSVFRWRRDYLDLILNRYRHGLIAFDFNSQEGQLEREIASLKGFGRNSRSLAHIQADTLAREMSTGFLYRAALFLPGLGNSNTLGFLERRLQIDTNSRRRVIVPTSGVSGWTRLFDGMAIRQWPGAFWVSFDFANQFNGLDRFKNPFAFVAGGLNEFSFNNNFNRRNFDFDQNGGEIIWNNRNGTNAYLLVDGNGRVVDIAPQEVVTHGGTFNHAIFNGRSCMQSCHIDSGMQKDFKDVGKEFIAQNSRSFGANEGAVAAQILQGKEGVTPLFQTHEQRYAQAKQALGIGNNLGEATTYLFLRSEAPMNIHMVASMLGVTSQQLEQGIKNDPLCLGRNLGSLLIKDGVLPRKLVEQGAREIAFRMGTGRGIFGFGNNRILFNCFGSVSDRQNRRGFSAGSEQPIEDNSTGDNATEMTDQAQDTRRELGDDEQKALEEKVLSESELDKAWEGMN